MCRTVLIPCNGAHGQQTSGPSFLGTLAGAALAGTAKLLFKAAELLLAALIAAIVWTAPRAWQLTVRVTRAGWARWQASRPITGQIQAPTRAAITDLPDGHVRWSELRTKMEANAR